MRYYLIAGESSGDLHASHLMRAILSQDPQAVFRYWGGDKMLEVSPSGLVKHIGELSFMGFWEVLKNIRTIFRNLAFCKQDIQRFSPEVVIFIDYPGFNLRIAPFVHQLGIKTFYYISPQLWAWKEGRIEIIKKYVDRMYVILPFEKEYYLKRSYAKVFYAGHPLMDELKGLNLDILKPKSNQVAVLPGSRLQEIERMLPVFSQVFQTFSQVQFVICGVSHLPMEVYEKYLHASNVRLVFGQTYQTLKTSRAALVTSGTATLETALLDVPQIVCYKANSISYSLAKYFIRVPYISLVNLILDKPSVQELIQHHCNLEAIQKLLPPLLDDSTERSNMLKDYQLLRGKLSESGVAGRIAKDMLQHLSL